MYIHSLCEQDAVIILIVNKHICLICQCTAEKLTSHSFACTDAQKYFKVHLT